MLEIFNYPKSIQIPQDVFKTTVSKGLRKQFKPSNISIIFVDLKEIQRLNKEYRDVDTPTDVLSFNYDSDSLLGEVYVCEGYIQKNTKTVPLNEEIVRLIVHGILHLYGYDHKTEFIDINQPNLENMYIIQESIVKDIIKKI